MKKSKKPSSHYSFDMKNILTASTLFVVLVAFIAVLYRNTEDELHSRLRNILSGLITIDKKHEVHYPKVAVGYGACKDIVFNAADVIPYEEFVNDEVAREFISSYDDLLSSFAYYFSHGAAAERFTSNSTLFNELVNRVNKLRDRRVAFGGNGASIAKRFAMEGFNVLLSSTTTKEMRDIFPQNLNIIGEIADEVDIHLVFEYKAKETWGPYTAPRANRFILHHDYHNPRVSSLERFDPYLKSFRPDLFVVSGLQMMDNYPMAKKIRHERLQAVKRQMNELPRNTKIHFEMASITEPNLLFYILDHVIPFADSLGMNEQELANLHSALLRNTITLATDSNPKISHVLDMMRQIFKQLQEKRDSVENGRPLSRLHVHTLAYQLIMVSKNSNWKNTFVAAARASLVANTYVCGTAEVDIDRSTLVIDESFSISSIPGSRRIYFDDQNPVACWNENDYHICLAPNLVCTYAKQTAGCGDNISAAGLAAQI